VWRRREHFGHASRAWFLGHPVLALALPTLLVAISLWLDGKYARMRETGELVSEISDRHVRAIALIGNLRKAETAQRGFVITRIPAFLDRYEPSRQAVDHEFAMLDQGLGANRLPLSRVNVLRGLIDAKFREMDDVLAKVRADRPAAAVAQVCRGQGQMLMERIEAELQAIIAANASRLAQGRSAY